jgi:hypothetical protein
MCTKTTFPEARALNKIVCPHDVVRSRRTVGASGVLLLRRQSIAVLEKPRSPRQRVSLAQPPKSSKVSICRSDAACRRASTGMAGSSSSDL